MLFTDRHAKLPVFLLGREGVDGGDESAQAAGRRETCDSCQR